MTTHEVPAELVTELNEAAKRVQSGLPDVGASTAEVAGLESPFVRVVGDRAIRGYSGDQWGANSLENFADVSRLWLTHDDASGFLDYLDNFAPYNYWLGDGNVQVWQYEEAYDNWQDTWGTDAVLVFYHSGHGGMDGNGVFQVPLGASWDGRTWAFSDRMALGNEQVRYVFWSTCLSLRVLGGHNPIRTWWSPNLGFRMLFGYETVSVDHGGYGSAFWSHWNAGKSFSQAFCDASWYNISTHQAPSVVACGIDGADASNRLYNERYFDWNPVSKNWWQWRWYYAASSAAGARVPRFELPDRPLVARLQRQTVDAKYLSAVEAQHGIHVDGPVRQHMTATGPSIVSVDGDARVAVAPDGCYEVAFAAPNRENKSQIPIRSAIREAQNIASQHGIDREPLVFDRVLLQYEAGGTAEGDGELREPGVTETVVQFTQTVNGLPVLAPGRGQISIGIDNDGKLTSIRNSARPIVELTDKKRRTPTPPSNPSGPSAYADEEPDPEAMLDRAWERQIASSLVDGRLPKSWVEVPGTSEIGYVIKGDDAVLVARRELEVDHGRGILKRHRVEVSLAE